jgi:uncharacterized protein
MKQSIYSPEPHRGWLPWTWLAPIIGVLLIALPSIPIDTLLEELSVVDAEGEPTSAISFCVFLLFPFTAMGLAAWLWVRLVERRALSTVGLTGTGRLRKFLSGLSIGVAMMAATTVSIWLLGGFRAGDAFPAFGSPAALFWIVLLLLCFFVQAGVEEFIFRGWLLSAATRRWNLTAGFTVSTLSFTFVHLSPHIPLQDVVMTVTFALFACAWAWRANSIWGVMGWHAGWNWIGGVGFDVPITGLEVHLPAFFVRLVPQGPAILNGGAAGPESSVLTTGMLAVATLALLLLPRRSDKDSRPSLEEE